MGPYLGIPTDRMSAPSANTFQTGAPSSESLTEAKGPLEGAGLRIRCRSVKSYRELKPRQEEFTETDRGCWRGTVGFFGTLDHGSV